VVVVVLCVVVILNQWMGTKFDFECRNCGHRITPSPVMAALAPHSFGKKLLKCPECGSVTWTQRVPKE
jgi:DNA-directed RNA polymerase subunit RPC12/RpoP